MVDAADDGAQGAADGTADDTPDDTPDDDEVTPTWPPHWEADVTTADGGTVHVRPITPADADGLVEFHSRQSPESIYLRYFSARPVLSAAEVRRFTHVDMTERVAFIALLGDVLIGVGRYDRYRDSGEAEVAFFIDDEHHGRGLATILLEYLAAAGRDNGVTAFVASVLPSNRAMVGVFTGAGFDVASNFADGVIEVRFEIAATPESIAAVEERATRSDARTVARLMQPRSVAVIGAGRRQGSIGHEILRQLVAHEFAGPVYAVNREATHVASVPAWPSVLDVPETVDLAVVAVPASEVLEAVEECARARVGALAVVSTGFAEGGQEGAERSRALVELAHRHGIRVLGPGSLGVINTAPDVRLHASFSPASPAPGHIGLSLQSGTLGAGIVRQATVRGLGFSSIVAVGDKLDVSGNDLLAWWEADERTHVVALSLASYGNPRRFRRLAPRIARSKPIVAMLREVTGDIPDLLAQMGVLGVHTLDDMLDLMAVLDGQAVPSGNRVAIVADALGSVSFTEAACRAAGLHVEATVAMDPEAEPADFATAVSTVLTDDVTPVDAAIVVYSAALLPRPEEVAAAIAAAHGASESASAKTVVAAFPGHDIGGHLPATGTRRIPDLGFPDSAARALAAAARYGMWLRQPVGDVPDLPGLDLAAAEKVVRGWIGRAALDHVDYRDVSGLLAVAGLSLVEQRFVSDAGEAAAAAATIGRPVALKALTRAPGAKTEAAGVALDLQNADEVSASWPRMAASLGSGMTSAVVQAMVPPGLDLRIVLEPAPIVGSVIGVGAGGVHPRTLAPVARAVLPLTDVTARALLVAAGIDLMMEASRLDAVVDVLLRLSALADEVPHLERLDLNPVIVSDGQAWLVDGTATVIPNPDQAPEDLRRLSR